MKRRLIACLIGILLLGVLTLEFVSGQLNCSDNQILFKLSGKTNAHAEIWNQTFYNEKICYDQIFRSAWAGNAHQCIGSNTILRLSDITNAHAETPFESTSPQNVCYGNLNCTFISSGNCSQLDGGPSAGGKKWCNVVSLSGETNAHLSLGYFYNYAICCKSATADCWCDYDGTCEPSANETEEYCADCVHVCGDGKITGIETCDVGNVTKNCTDWPSYIGGTLECSADCLSYNFDNCVGPQCAAGGNPEGNQICRLGQNQTCVDANGYKGNQSCYDCYNWNACIVTESCGDGKKNGNEECDREDFGNTDGCEEVGAFRGGNLTCDVNSCKFDVGECIPKSGFCEDERPFFYRVNGTPVFPGSCYEYNLVYPNDDKNRKDLCENDCAGGASDPGHNGYSGSVFTESGCAWDYDNEECYFYFSQSGGGLCRSRFESFGECGPDDISRTVVINATPIGDWIGTCNAGCGSSECSSTIPCSGVVALSFFNWVTFIFSAAIISIIYFYLARRK